MRPPTTCSTRSATASPQADLDEQLDKLQTHPSTRGHAPETISLIRAIAERTYADVVYSCGALVHAETLMLPYGIGDAAICIATVPLPELLAALGG